MRKTIWLIVFVIFAISAIGVMAAKAANPKRSKKVHNMQSKQLALKWKGVRSVSTLSTSANKPFQKPQPRWLTPVAFDSSLTLRQLADMPYSTDLIDKPEDLGLVDTPDAGFSGDGAVQSNIPTLNIPTAGPNFEGLSNQDNFNVYGGRVNPPDSDGDVGPNHYVQLINLVLGIYDKQGNKLLGPVPIGALWSGFAIPDCTDPSGDPIVLYDQHVGRWIYSQFTTRGFSSPFTAPFYNCVAVSKTPDPLGAYYRYAFITQPDPDPIPGSSPPAFGYFFPDYPKYGVWTHSYALTTRDFGVAGAYGISVYALEKAQMISGNPKARAVQFFLDNEVVGIDIIGDGLLPGDWDGGRKPQDGAPIPIVGTMDDGAFYGAPFDGLNAYELRVLWNSKPVASLDLVDQLPTAAFDSIFPCAPGARDCLQQPPPADTAAQNLDILSYRQRPTWRLAYRNFGTYESMVTNQSVEAATAQAGVRWYEIRRTNGSWSIYQQGTYAPSDGVHRWMGSIAQDKQGNMLLGYSVVHNPTNVMPGIRYTGRLKGDPLGQMTFAEGTIINGTGVQRTTNSRWGDYSSMNLDPKDDCTFWYTDEYYTLAGQLSSTAGWQHRIASFKVPGCK